MSHRAKVLAPDGAAYDQFGQSIAIYNGIAIDNSEYGNGSGKTYAFSE